MKKAISIVTAIVLAGTISMGAFAKSDKNEHAAEPKQARQTEASQVSSKAAAAGHAEDERAEEKQENHSSVAAEKQEQLSAKKEEFAAFKTALKAKQQLMLQNREEIRVLAKENQQLRVKLLQSIESISENGGTLPDATLTKLTEYKAQIKEIVTAMKGTTGDISDLMKQSKELIKNKDYAAMDAAFAEVGAVQQKRQEQMAQIKTLLQEMIALVAATAIPAPAVTTSPEVTTVPAVTTVPEVTTIPEVTTAVTQ